MAEHTPTPWHIEPYYALGPEQEIVGSNGEPICTVLGSKDFTEDTEGWIEPDAAFIVRAVNCHEELVEALEFAHSHVDELCDAWERGAISEHDGKGGLRSNRNTAVEMKIRAALAKAKESRLQQQDLDEETL